MGRRERMEGLLIGMGIKPESGIAMGGSKEETEAEKMGVVEVTTDSRAFQDLAGDLEVPVAENGAAAHASEMKWVVELSPEGDTRRWGLTKEGVAERAERMKRRREGAADIVAAKKATLNQIMGRNRPKKKV